MDRVEATEAGLWRLCSALDWYNGYSPQERAAMGRAPAPPSAKAPPCSICGDPDPPKMQTHAEDYSKPYRWLPPAAYSVCTRCHSRLHSRFDSPSRWQAYLRFLRRGWYGREVSSEDIKRLCAAGDAYEWPQLVHEPPARSGPMAWWWETLTMDSSSRRSAQARPRP
jgi:hypothetical protein